jgi:hypothetical protein
MIQVGVFTVPSLFEKLTFQTPTLFEEELGLIVVDFVVASQQGDNLPDNHAGYQCDSNRDADSRKLGG